jgi:hypothetical protein
MKYDRKYDYIYILFTLFLVLFIYFLSNSIVKYKIKYFQIRELYNV